MATTKINPSKHLLNTTFVLFIVFSFQISLNSTQVSLDEKLTKLENLLKSFSTKFDGEIRSVKTRLNSIESRLPSNLIKNTTTKSYTTTPIRAPIEGKLVRTIDSDYSTTSLVALKDGTFASGSDFGPILIWNIENGNVLRTLTGHTNIVRCLKELKDGSLASGSWDKTIKIWNAQKGTLMRAMEEDHKNWIESLEQLHNGLLASGSRDGTVKIWNTNSGKLVKTVVMGEQVRQLGLLRDGSLAVILDSKLTILNTRTYEVVRTVVSYEFNCLVGLNDGNLAIGEIGSNVTIWKVSSTNMELVRTLRGHASRVWYLLVLRDGMLASGAEDGEIKIWNAQSGGLMRTISAGNRRIDSMAQSSDGSLASSSSFTDKINIWK